MECTKDRRTKADPAFARSAAAPEARTVVQEARTVVQEARTVVQEAQTAAPEARTVVPEAQTSRAGSTDETGRVSKDKGVER